MKQHSAGWGAMTIGLDVGDRFCRACVLAENGSVTAEGRMATTERALWEWFAHREPARVALEVGTHSPWISRLLSDCGHEVLVANPRQVRLIYANVRKNDRLDASALARLARLDPQLLAPIQHRGAEAQADLALLRARDALVRTRTSLVNHARGSVKSVGGRLPRCSPRSLPQKGVDAIPAPLRPALDAVLEQIAVLTATIAQYDREVARLAQERYPETKVLRQVPGVGPLTSLAFILTLEDSQRFARSRDVGPYLGLTPRRSQSGAQDPQLRITKAGDVMLRRLLVGSAQYILGPFGPDTDLRRHGLALAARGGRNGKKRAVVAVARKLAVLLHRLWVTGECYEPLRQTAARAANQEVAA
jgi:transposase